MSKCLEYLGLVAGSDRGFSTCKRLIVLALLNISCIRMKVIGVQFWYNGLKGMRPSI